MTPEEQTIWAAGFFDGEGCVTVGKAQIEKQVQYSLLVQLANTNVRSLFTLQDRFGGKIYPMRHNGKVRSFTWTPQPRKNLISFLKEIRPYLIVKIEQVDLALEYCDLGGRRVPNLRDYYYHRMRELNGTSTRGRPRKNPLKAKSHNDTSS